MAVDKRFRNACFLVYPDSAPDDWIEILRSQRVPFIVSPLHDKDKDLGELDGNLCELPKKPHYHVAVTCDGNKPLSYFTELAKSVNGTIAWKIENLRSMLRYFCHLDNPEKYQYPMNEMRSFCGASVKDAMLIEGYELTSECMKIQTFIQQMKFSDFHTFTNYLKDNGLFDWYHIVTAQRTAYFSAYMKDIYIVKKVKEKNLC